MKTLTFLKNIKRTKKDCRLFKKIVLYNLITLMTVTLFLFEACKKDDGEVDLKKEQYKKLQVDSTRLAGEVRAAVLPAKTVTSNIAVFFDQKFSYEAENSQNGWPQNLPDSADIFIKTVNNIKNSGVTLNGPTLDSLKSKSNSYLSTIEAINELLNKTSR